MEQRSHESLLSNRIDRTSRSKNFLSSAVYLSVTIRRKKKKKKKETMKKSNFTYSACLSWTWYELTIVSSLITSLRRRRWTTTRTNHHATTGQITWAPRCTSPRNWNIEHPLPLLHITGKHNSSIISSIYISKYHGDRLAHVSLSPPPSRGGERGRKFANAQN